MKRNQFTKEIIATLLAKSSPLGETKSRVAFATKRQSQYLPDSWSGEIDGISVCVSFDDLPNGGKRMHWFPSQCDVEVRVYRNILLERGVTPPEGTFVDHAPQRYGAPPIDDRYRAR